MIITLDGHAGGGKSTVAKKLAAALGFAYFDTGALYRSLTWFLLHKGVDVNSDVDIEKALQEFRFYTRQTRDGQVHFFVGDQEVTKEIRCPEITEKVSPLSAKAFLRKKLLPLQRDFASGNHVVFEGRDMGSVVFPGADVKFFLTADLAVRAKRRLEEWKEKFPEKKESFSLENIQKEIEERDRRDSEREASPLKCPEDAILIDTSHLSIEKVTEILLFHVQKKRLEQFPKMKLFYRFILFLCRCWFKIFYRYRVFGLEHFQPGSALLAGNHVSFYDPIAVSIGCPEEIQFVAKESLFSIPLFGSLISRLNAHPISGKASDKATFRQILDLLKQGKKVLVFPEGSRSHSDTIGEILPGIGLFSFLTKSAILPVYVEGTFEVWNASRKLPKLFGKITCVFGSPILPFSFSGMQKKQAIAEMSERLLFSLKQLEDWVSKGCQGNPP
jgi:cytidylate kinase